MKFRWIYSIPLAISAVFPLFWFFGALTLITPQGSLDRIFMPWFKDFAPSADSWLNTLQVEAEKEEYLARMRVAEIRWAKRCLYAFSLLLLLVAAAVGTAIGVSRIQWQKYLTLLFVDMPVTYFFRISFFFFRRSIWSTSYRAICTHMHASLGYMK